VIELTVFWLLSWYYIFVYIFTSESRPFSTSGRKARW